MSSPGIETATLGFPIEHLDRMAEKKRNSVLVFTVIHKVYEIYRNIHLRLFKGALSPFKIRHEVLCNWK